MARVLALTNLYPPHYLGGYETTCMDVVDRLRRRGHEVTVLTSTLRVPGVDDPADEPHVERSLELTSRYAPRQAAPWRRPFMERRNLARLRHALGTARPDVVVVWNMFGMSLSLVAELADLRMPLVFVVADDWLVEGGEGDAWMRPLARHPFVRWVAGSVFRVPTRLPEPRPSWRFCFASEALLERVQRESGRRYPNVEITPLGVDLDDFPVVGRGARPSWSGRLIYVGRIHQAKGVYTLLQAMASLPPEVTVEVIGRGDHPSVEHFTRELAAANLGERVTRDAVPRRELARRYRAADACVFPSEWEEPFGIVPLEAMACGTPVVATGVGGSGAYLRHGENCLLFPPGDPDGLAAAVMRLAVDEDLREQLVEGGMRTAAAYTVEALTSRLESALLQATQAG